MSYLFNAALRHHLPLVHHQMVCEAARVGGVGQAGWQAGRQAGWWAGRRQGLVAAAGGACRAWQPVGRVHWPGLAAPGGRHNPAPTFAHPPFLLPSSLQERAQRAHTARILPVASFKLGQAFADKLQVEGELAEAGGWWRVGAGGGCNTVTGGGWRGTGGGGAGEAVQVAAGGWWVLCR